MLWIKLTLVYYLTWLSSDFFALSTNFFLIFMAVWTSIVYGWSGVAWLYYTNFTALQCDVSWTPLINFDKTDRQYSLALLMCLDSRGQGQGHSRPSRWRKRPRRCWGVEVHLLVVNVVCRHSWSERWNGSERYSRIWSGRSTWSAWWSRWWWTSRSTRCFRKKGRWRLARSAWRHRS